MKNQIFTLIALTFLAFASMPVDGIARTWTRASDGAKIEGEFVRMKDNATVFIRRDGGAVVEVPVAMLVQEDQDFIQQQLAAAMAPGKPVLPEGETEVTLSNVHLCCGGCRRAVEKAVTDLGNDLEVSASGSSVVVKGKKGSDVQKALDAIAEAGFYGTSDHDVIKIAEAAASEEAGSTKVKVSGVHLCCDSCVDAVSAALSSVEGFKEHDAETKGDSFEVTGEGIKASDVLAALHAKGLHGTVR